MLLQLLPQLEYVQIIYEIQKICKMRNRTAVRSLARN